MNQKEPAQPSSVFDAKMQHIKDTMESCSEEDSGFQGSGNKAGPI